MGQLENGIVANGQIAITANAPQNVPRLLEEVAFHGNALIQDDPKARMKLLDAARSLVTALETPREAMIRYCWSQVSLGFIGLILYVLGMR